MGNSLPKNRLIQLVTSKFINYQKLNWLVLKNLPHLTSRQTIPANKITALIPCTMPPNKGRTVKAALVNADKLKADEAIEAGDTIAKETTKGRKKIAPPKENGVSDRVKFIRGRKAEVQIEQAAAEVPKTVTGKSKEKVVIEEALEEPEPKKDKKEAAKDVGTPPKKSGRGRKKVVPVENQEKTLEEEVAQIGKKATRAGRHKAGPIEHVDNADEAPRATKGKKKAVDRSEEVEKKTGRGRKKAAVSSDDEGEKYTAVKRGRKAKVEQVPKDEGKVLSTIEEDQVSVEKLPTNKRGRNILEDASEKIAKSQPATKRAKTDVKKLINKTDTNFDNIDFGCDKINANGDKFNVKICSWNVAGIRSVEKKQGIQYCLKEDADILLMQETKCDADKLPDAWNLPGYKRYYVDSEKSGYAGIVLYSKKEPLNIKYGLENGPCQNEGRLITAEYEKYYIINVYVPNAGKALVNLNKRVEWNKVFQNYVQELDEKKPVIICGDMNVAHTEIDLTNPKTNTKNAGFTPQEREGMTDLLAAGFVDSFRHFHPEKIGAYTFWSYFHGARGKNIGWRLDYFIVSEKIKDHICDNVMRSDVFGSDHCPIVLYAHL